MKVTIVCESMFGNTHEVAKAISEGVREAHSDADVECVPVAEASPELIKSTDLLVVGGPTHIRGMTSGFGRKMGVSGEEKLGQKASRLMRWERMPKAQGFESGSTVCQGLGMEAGPPPSIPASRPVWQVARPAALPVGCVSTDTTW
jgi:hypothetical protein